MAPKSCHICGSSALETDYTLGQVACTECGTIVERGILVSEVGFAEASGGRMHATGTHVAFGSSGFRGGKDSGQNAQAVKQAGQERIQQTARAMGLGTGISNGAQRSFSLAVDQRFNKGRRTDYLVASCLYLQCRLMKEPYMLIDFSERLQVNVFELAGTYLKLRTNLHLDKTMPEVDPAIYNIHFARRLALGPDAQAIAADASRLVRRFKADWMTQGRRPAGICGACLIIAARMSNYLRTPEEVGQVVKCSAYTIRKRLREFAVTEMAQKTVKEWRGLSEKELDEVREEEPPIVTQNRRLKERAERERLEREEEAAEEAAKRGEGSEEDEDEGSVQGKGKGKARDKGKKRKEREASGLLDAEAAIREAAAEAARQEEEDGVDEDEEANLENLMGAAMADDIDAAGDDPAAAQRARKAERMAFQRENRAMNKALLGAQEEEVDDADAEELQAHEDDGEKEEGDPTLDSTRVDDTALVGIGKIESFTEWDDPASTLQHFTEEYFAADPRLVNLDPGHVKDRIAKWLGTDRDPKEVAYECFAVEMAYKRREFQARESKLESLEDLDDAELEDYYLLDERDKQLRARVWLSQNGKWLEQSKIKEEERAAYNKANNIDPNKPKPKRRKTAGNGPTKPYKSTRDAMEGFAAQKKFSSRINYGALNMLGGYSGEAEDMGEAGLQRMDEKEEDFADLVGYGDDDKEDDNDYW